MVVVFTFYVFLFYFVFFFGLRSWYQFSTCLRPFITFILTVTAVPWLDFKPTFIFPILWVSSFRECEMALHSMYKSGEITRRICFIIPFWPPYPFRIQFIQKLLQHPSTSFGRTIDFFIASNYFWRCCFGWGWGHLNTIYFFLVWVLWVERCLIR